MAFAERRPALFGSVALHAGILGATVVAWPWAKPDEPKALPVPITIVASAPRPEPIPPEPVEAPEPTPAQAPEIAPEPTPPAPAPAPAPPRPTPPKPTPAPPKPTPKPTPPKPAPPKPTPKPAPAKPTPAPAKPTPKPTPAKPAPAKSAPAKPAPAKSVPAKSVPAKPTPAKPTQVARAEPGFDLDALASDLQRSAPANRRRPAAPSEGETRAAASPSAGPPAAVLLGPVIARLQRNWNPNCGVDGAEKLNIRVRLKLRPDGSLAAPPELPDGQNPGGSSVEDVAAARALRAVNAAAPFDELPTDAYDKWKDFTARFNGKTACAGR